ncbi:MAG: energy transducer TonB [Deltaproteobacteria bacterium]|nr:MAG: energy transducer TonB [Deltaproteobacteria bacterium]
MFHYRPAISGRQFRILVAAFAAIAAHIGLISLTIDPKSDFAPHISLPHSVNVFLGQNSTLPASSVAEKVVQKEIIEEKPPIPDEVETMHPIIEATTFNKEQEIEVQRTISPELTNKAVKEPAVEKKQVIRKEAEPDFHQSQKASKPDAESPAHKQSVVSRTEQAAILAGEGVELPGTLQIAHPRYQFNSPPLYPGLARKRGQQGTVILQVLVNKEGRVEDLKIDVSSNFSMLDRAAIKAVKKWLFEPGRKDAEKVVMWVKVPVTFKLNRQ